MLKLKQNKKGDHYFRLKSEKGHTLLRSKGFKKKEELDIVVSNLETIIKVPTLFERKTNYKGEFLFTLKDNTGKTIGSSAFYTSEAGMENGIKNLKNLSAKNLFV